MSYSFEKAYIPPPSVAATGSACLAAPAGTVARNGHHTLPPTHYHHDDHFAELPGVAPAR
jgi:hypothetical protein